MSEPIRSISLVLRDACVCLLLFAVISWKSAAALMMFSDMMCSFMILSLHIEGNKENLRGFIHEESACLLLDDLQNGQSVTSEHWNSLLIKSLC